MINMRTITVVGTLALFGATGCADLAVENPNAPDAERALATAGDVESLIAGSYRQWWLSSGDYSGASFFLSTASFQHSAWPANAGAVFYSSFPRGQIVNDIADQYYGNMSYTWRQANRALAAVSDGLRAIENNPDIASELGPNSVRRIKTFGKFVQGLAHGSLALFYDQGFIIDEEVPTRDDGGAPAELEPVPYGQMMEAALGYFDEAIALAGQGDFTIPSDWMSVAVKSDQLARIAHSMKARYRAVVSRTQEERATVD